MLPRKTHWTGNAWVTRREYDQQQQVDRVELLQRHKSVNETTMNPSPKDYKDCIGDLLGSKHISRGTRRLLTFCTAHQSRGGMLQNRPPAVVKPKGSGIKPRDNGTGDPLLARPKLEPVAMPRRRRGRPLGWRKVRALRQGR